MYNMNIIESIMEIIFVFVYFNVVSNCIYQLLIKKHIINLFSKKIALDLLLSLCFTVILFPSMQITFYRDNNISVIATGHKNLNAQGSEVWISKISIDGEVIDLSLFELPTNWFFIDGNIVSYPDQEENIINFKLPKAETVEITFINHPWSGMVRVESSNKIIGEYDLYASESSSITCEISGEIIESPLLFIINIFLIYMTIFYFLLILLNIKKPYSNIIISTIGTIILLSQLEDFSENWKTWDKIVFFLLIHSFCFSIEKIKLCSKKEAILILIGSILSSFMFFGSSLFIIQESISIRNIVLFFTLIIYMLPITSCIINLFSLAETKLFLYSKKALNKKFNKIMTVLFAMIYSGIITSVIYQITGYTITSSELYIKASGEKNEKSQGYEVLIGSVAIDGHEYSLSELIDLPEGWNDVGGMAIGRGDNEVHLSFNNVNDVKILFNKHQWSGIVEIIDRDEETFIDLYSNSSTSYIKTYQVTGIRNYNFNFKNVVCYAMLFAALFGVTFWILYEKYVLLYKKPGPYRFLLVSTFLILGCFLTYLLASFPAALSIDSRTQLEQIYGWAPLTDAHPAVHTLLMKLLLSITGNTFGIVLTFSVFESLLISIILLHLYKKGINPKFLLGSGCFFALCVNNGVYTTTLWKDVPYTYFILWATYLLYRSYSENNFVNKPKNIVAIIIALSGICLLRHNGLVIIILTACYFIVIAVKRKENRYILILLGVIFTISFTRGPVYSMIGVQNIENITTNTSSSAPLLHGLVYSYLEGKAPDEVCETLNNIMSEEEWRVCYTPYSSNELYTSDTAIKNDVTEKISEIGTGNMLKYYLKTLPTGLWQLIKDRLTGADLLWNVFRDHGYDWRVANDTYEIGVVSNDFGIYRSDNLLTDLLKPIVQITIDISVFDSIFWRAGIWLVFLIHFIIYLLIKRSKMMILIMPCVGNIISLLLAMVCQDYRYVYFLEVCMIFIFLLNLSNHQIESNRHTEIKK